MRVAVLGTGIMGSAMARSLAREGHDVGVWNRHPEKARAAAGPAITAYDEIEGALDGADVVLTVLFDAASVLAVTPEVTRHLGPEAVWAQVTTVGPAGIEQIAAAAEPVRERLLDAPVLGTRQPAEDGKLTVLVSGPAPARGTAQPVFEAVGARTITVGDDLGRASGLKLVCNSWIAGVNAAAAQALAFADALGLDPGLFLEAIQGGAADSAYAQAKGVLMQSREWDDPSFALDSVVKDVGLMVEAAGETGLPDDLLATLLALYDRASARGVGGADMAAVRVAFDR
jgi:3-hydroxyisobutyrate dehydrogenase